MITTTLRRTAARIAAITLPAAAVVTLLGAPAQAKLNEPAILSTPVAAPSLTITVVEIPATGFRVCVNGTSATPGEWAFDVDGFRSDESLIQHSASGYGTTFNPPCYTVTEDGTVAGEWHVLLSHTRANVTYARGGGGTWDLQTGEHSWDTA